MSLKEIRQARCMSQTDLAKATGISKRQIQAYEQGYRDINGSKLLTLLSLANVLNCEIDQILTDGKTKQMMNVYNARIQANRFGGGKQ